MGKFDLVKNSFHGLFCDTGIWEGRTFFLRILEIKRKEE